MDPAATMLPFLRRLGVLGLALAAMAACTAAPATPEPPDYVVFFTPVSAELDDAARSVVADASSAAKRFPDRRVVVSGYATRIGPPDTVETLSKLRAQVVTDGLAANGVDRGRIVLRPRGASGGDPGIESRRVAIEIE